MTENNPENGFDVLPPTPHNLNLIEGVLRSDDRLTYLLKARTPVAIASGYYLLRRDRPIDIGFKGTMESFPFL
jgi:hypothetical protein